MPLASMAACPPACPSLGMPLYFSALLKTTTDAPSTKALRPLLRVAIHSALPEGPAVRYAAGYAPVAGSVAEPCAACALAAEDAGVTGSPLLINTGIPERRATACFTMTRSVAGCATNFAVRALKRIGEVCGSSFSERESG